ncbi:hypothetical protein D9M69_631070 [compost metagenome]
MHHPGATKGPQFDPTWLAGQERTFAGPCSWHTKVDQAGGRVGRRRIDGKGARDKPIHSADRITISVDDLIRSEPLQMRVTQQFRPEGLGHIREPRALAHDLFCLFSRQIQHGSSTLSKSGQNVVRQSNTMRSSICTLLSRSQKQQPEILD